MCYITYRVWTAVAFFFHYWGPFGDDLVSLKHGGYSSYSKRNCRKVLSHYVDAVEGWRIPGSTRDLQPLLFLSLVQ